MTLAQILTTAIFVIMFAAIIWGKIHRFIPALIGAALVIIVFLTVSRSSEMVINVFNVQQLIQGQFWMPSGHGVESHGINWQTIIFIGGMMIMVEGLGQGCFFRWLCLFLAKLVHYKVVPILVLFMILSGFLFFFLDSI